MAITTRSDEQIQKDVFAELKWDTRVMPNEIGMAVKDGVLGGSQSQLLVEGGPSCS